MRARIFAEHNRKWLTLAAVSFGLFMIMLDNTVVNVALPSIQRDLDADLSELQWIVTGYALTFAALMLVGGKLADAYGVHGLRAKEPTDVGPLVKEAIGLERPVLIEVPVGRMPRPVFFAARKAPTKYKR